MPIHEQTVYPNRNKFTIPNVCKTVNTTKAANKDIREAAASAGVFLWQVAEAIGVTDGTFSRKLRRELPDDDKAAILQIIQQLSSSAKL